MTAPKTGTIVPLPPLNRHNTAPNRPNRHVLACELQRDDDVIIDVDGKRRVGRVWAILKTDHKSNDYIKVALYPQGYLQRNYIMHKTEKVEIYD